MNYRVILIFFLVVALNTFSNIQFSLASECAVTSSSENLVTLFDYNSFSSSTPLDLLFSEITGSQLQLTDNEVNGGTWALAWNSGRERIADGFISEFSVTVAGSSPANNGLGDGFTYIIQNYKIDDLNGGSGSNLGVSGIRRSLAIKFDLCPDRPASCDGESGTITAVITDDDGVSGSPITGNPSCDNFDLTGQSNVEVIYTGRVSSPKVTVSIGACTLEINQNLEDLFGSRFAWFGFSASTSYDQTADIRINAWSVKLQPSSVNIPFGGGVFRNEDQLSSAPRPQRDDPKIVYLDDEQIIRITEVDSCGERIASSQNAEVSVVVQKQQPEGTDPRDFVFADVTLEFVGGDDEDFPNSWLATFTLNELATWDVDILLNGIRPDGIPRVAAFESVTRPFSLGSIEDWQLALVILAIIFVLVALSYVIYRLYRYRKKLKENEEFIEAGKKQAELDRLEDGTTYAMNPMMGTLDDLKEQLARNEEELQKLRARGEGGIDQEHTIDQLSKQRDGLLEEMNRMKQEQQKKEASEMQGARVNPRQNRRKQFGQQTAE